MSEINSIGQPNNAAIGRVAARRAAAASQQTAASAGRRGDSVELSTAARMLDQLSRLPNVREELVARVRDEIAAGTYETPDKIDATVNALIHELQ